MSDVLVKNKDAKIIKMSDLSFVIKRDGVKMPFDSEKIFVAIKKAGTATEEFEDVEARMLADQVIKVLRYRHFEDKYPTIEQIQDVVEQTLISNNFVKTARAYIVYREQRAKARQDKKVIVDAISSINEYLSQADWRVNANANQGYSIGGLILNIAGKLTANYWLSNLYPREAGECHRNGDFYIHDLDMLTGYCAGWSLKMLLQEGFNGVPNKVESSAPKHFGSALGQAVNFLGTLQNEWAGAQAFSSFDTYLAPYIRNDNIEYKEVKQHIQEFVYNLNVPSRWGMQTPFTNLTFDWKCPEDLEDTHPVIAGKEMDFKYGELQKEMDMINKAYIEVMCSGDAKGRQFTFPIPTYNITKDFPWNDENTNLLFEMTAKYGTPYFQNFINSHLSPKMVRSMCCRLQLDLKELLARGNGLFGSAEQTGSIGVITINLARLGYVFKGDEEGLYKKLDHLLELAKNTLEVKRKTIQSNMDNGLYPFTARYLGTLRNHFSTIGINGGNEMIRNFTDDKHNIADQFGREFILKLLNHIREKMIQFQSETGNMYNLEATPAEATTYKLAKSDKEKFPGILQAGTETNPYYTNSTQLPVGFSDDPFEALDLQDELQTKYTGGTVLHLYMGERISDAEKCKQIVKTVLENYKLPYMTITPIFSICPKHGYISGDHEFCPRCDQEILARKQPKKCACDS